MQKAGYILYIGPLAGVALALTCYAVSNRAQSNRPAVSQEPIVLHVEPETAMGETSDFQGDPHAPYTLVEFADYQCGPCIAISKKVPDVLKKYPHKLRFAYRNFPLTMLHPQALPAAVAAESARRQGQFWAMHDGLFALRGRMDEMALNKLAANLHLNRERFAQDQMHAAKKAIDADTTAGKALGVSGTPTFILCCADRRVVRLSSLNQLSQFVR